MKEIMIKTIKEDITYMLAELGNIRKTELDNKFKNEENIKDLDKNSPYYSTYIMDFRPYRDMVITLIKTYDNLNKMYNYNIFKEDRIFVEYFVSGLFIKSFRLHKLMEICKDNYNQYRCLSDAYVKLTEKICKIERDRPMEFKNKQELRELQNNADISYIMSEEEIKKIIEKSVPFEINTISNLLKHQQEAVDFKGKNLICDWSRSAGKTFTIIKIIELNKPKNVLYISSFEDSLVYLIESLKTNQCFKNAEKIFKDEMSLNGVKIYTLDSLKRLDENIVFDYIFFDEVLPFNIGVKFKQSICFISYNDKDEWLERFYPNCKISKIDYIPLVESGLLNQKTIDECSKVNYKNYLNEFAILD